MAGKKSQRRDAFSGLRSKGRSWAFESSVALRSRPGEEGADEVPVDKSSTKDKQWKRWTQQRKRKLEACIDDVFCFLELSDPEDVSGATYADRSVNPKAFQEIELIMPELIPVGEDDWGIFGDTRPSDLPKSWDVSHGTVKEVEKPQELGGTERYAILHRMRTVPISRGRGHKLYSPYLCEYSFCDVSLDRGVYRGDVYLINWVGKEWQPISPSRMVKDIAPSGECYGSVGATTICHHDPEGDAFAYLAGMGIAFARDLCWRVIITSPCGQSISLPTSYAGAMAAFRNREPEETTGRRKALRHWVRQHYRRKAKQEEVEADEYVAVRRHLRGRTPFRWMGLDCQIVVPPIDERLNERLASQSKDSV